MKLLIRENLIVGTFCGVNKLFINSISYVTVSYEELCMKYAFEENSPSKPNVLCLNVSYSVKQLDKGHK